MAGQIIYIDNLKIKKTLKRINELIKDIERNGVLNGIGKRNIEKDLVEELTKLTGLSMPLMKMGFYG